MLVSGDKLTNDGPTAYWALDTEVILEHLASSRDGLSTTEAQRRIQQFGRNEFQDSQPRTRAIVLLDQIKSPLLLLLVFAAAASAFTGQWMDATIVLAIVVLTVFIGYTREYRAESAATALKARVHVKANVLRDGKPSAVSIQEIVPGDVVLLSAGTLAPGDGLVLEAADCFISEAVLTGESFPVRKIPGVLPAETPLARRRNCIFLGTNVRSGTAQCLIVRTGRETQFGNIAHRLTLRPPETEFDRGIKRFGYFLTAAMLIMIVLVFTAHAVRGRPPIETLLFAIALAVGLSPELLPAVLSVNLARGAELMAKRGVLVRHLNAIENLGSMDVLCTDKTGTLTEGIVVLDGAYDESGTRSQRVLSLASLNAALQTGLSNPMDTAILESAPPVLKECRKLGEIPFDFVRKRLSIVVRTPEGVQLITKGAFHHVIQVCKNIPDGLEERFQEWSKRGERVVAVAVRSIVEKTLYSRDDEHDLTFSGFLTFTDRPKQGVTEAITELAALGVSIKLITGDNKLVAQHVAGQVGLRNDRVLTGQQLDDMRDEALWHAAELTDLFVEVDPNQKERIILSLKKMGHVVGFLGDGVNDAPAMHAADTGISVEGAADVAREAADFVLLEQHLDVIRGGIEEGRRTFANTLKYIFTTTSANLGNMVSMAVASLFLPFLPLLPGQILLNNFLSDVPAIGVAGDSVDPELIARPRRWDIRHLGRFMVEFGILSSAFDMLTFFVLLVIFQATAETFRTGWFIESLLTELVIALVVRTNRPFYRSRPGAVLLWSTLTLIVVTMAIPYLPISIVLGFVPLSALVLASLAAITTLYVIATELMKQWSYRNAGR